jgi:hypothetical protein
MQTRVINLHLHLRIIRATRLRSFSRGRRVRRAEWFRRVQSIEIRRIKRGRRVNVVSY